MMTSPPVPPNLILAMEEAVLVSAKSCLHRKPARSRPPAVAGISYAATDGDVLLLDPFRGSRTPFIHHRYVLGLLALALFLEPLRAGTIEFKANQGAGKMGATSHEPGEYVTLAKNVFRMSGHVFSGWNTRADGSGVDYSDERKFFMPRSDLKLHAQWRAAGEALDSKGEDLVLEFVRAVPPQKGACYVEDYVMMVRAKHPDGVRQLQIMRPVSKIGKAEPPFKVFDTDLGIFWTKRRFKSGSSLQYAIMIQTETGEEISSVETYGDAGWRRIEYGKSIPEYLRFIGLQNGDSVKADQPFAIGVDAMDPDGSIHKQRKGHRYPIDDLNGVLSVALKVNGQIVQTKKNAPEPIAANETAAVNFGFYKFYGIKLSKGSHQLSIESIDREGHRSESKAITLISQ